MSYVSETERRQILHNVLTMEVSQGNRVAWVGVYDTRCRGSRRKRWGQWGRAAARASR